MTQYMQEAGAMKQADEQREAFEAWADTQSGGRLRSSNSNDYDYPLGRLMWAAWQAALAANEGTLTAGKQGGDGVAAVAPPSTAHIRSVPGGAAFLRVAAAHWCPSTAHQCDQGCGDECQRLAPDGVPAPARLVNGQWEGQPLSQFPELQAEVRKGLDDGTLEVAGGVALGGEGQQ